MADAPSTGQMLALFIFSFGLGSVAIVAIVAKRLWIQLAVTLAFVVASASLFRPDSASQTLFNPLGGPWPAFAIIDFAALGAARVIFSFRKKWRGTLRQWLAPQLWNASVVEDTSYEDLRRRWYVTVAAATGNVVGLLMSEPRALHIFWEAFGPDRRLGTILMLIISITLFGPGEEFVLGAAFRPANEAGGNASSHSHFEQLFRDPSWRTMGRIGMVLVAWLLFTITEGCMGETLQGGDVSRTSTEILLSVVPSGLITFYWCAALQRRVPEVTAFAARAVLAAGFLLFIPGALFMVLLDLQQTLSGNFSRVALHYGSVGALALAAFWIVRDFVFAFGFAAYMALFIYGLPAAWGGLLLDPKPGQPKRKAVVTIAMMIGAVCFAQFLVWGSTLWLVEHLGGITLSDDTVLPSLLFLLGTVAWGFGLLFSNFPQILEGARTRPPDAHAKV